MAWSITIGTVKGTVIRLHITFLLFLLQEQRLPAVGVSDGTGRLIG